MPPVASSGLNLIQISLPSLRIVGISTSQEVCRVETASLSFEVNKNGVQRLAEQIPPLDDHRYFLAVEGYSSAGCQRHGAIFPIRDLSSVRA